MKEFEAKSLCILGRQPALGLAELESLYGAEHVKPLPGTALLDIPAGDINFKRLGGTLKVAQLLNILPTNDWKSAYDYLAENIPKHLKYLPAPTPQGRGSDRSVGKGTFTLGVSVYGLDVNVKKLGADLLGLKKLFGLRADQCELCPIKHLSSTAPRCCTIN